jgi:hypothetical protein
VYIGELRNLEFAIVKAKLMLLFRLLRRASRKEHCQGDKFQYESHIIFFLFVLLLVVVNIAR